MRYTVLMRCSVLALSCAVGGCDSIWNFSNTVGDHMPVVSDRCEHWQCFTNPTTGADNPTPAKAPKSDAQDNTPAPVAQSSAPKTSTYSPVDMTPEQLQNLPPPAAPQGLQ